MAHPRAPEPRGLRGSAERSMRAGGVPLSRQARLDGDGEDAKRKTWGYFFLWGRNQQTSGYDEVYTTMIRLFQLIH